MGIIDRILKRRAPDPDARRRQLLANGRMTDGVIIDTELSAAGDEIVFYSYTLNGVDFESADILTDDQRGDWLKYAPGARIGIRYDQKNQGNSILE